jgi:aspartyl-tRNA(Asn)/glutamyl-tRNA(Gln) amidotransferase subunit A
MKEVLSASLKDIKNLLEGKKISCQELIKSFLDEIEKKDKQLHSYLSINDKALDEAKQVDKKISSGQSLGILEGVPVAVKDNICVEGMPATCASKMLENFEPPYNATVIEKLKSAGAIIIGKTNMDEFAFGSSTENSAFGPTRNPFDSFRVPGGSSGGSTAAVAANLCWAALGSDTGGSIRQPAAFCGVVGFKPTYGRVSRYGLVAFASSLDQIGPIAKNLEDTCVLLEVISGKDAMDSTSVNLEVPDYTKILRKDLKGVRIGIPKEYYGTAIAPEISKKVEDVLSLAEKSGAELKDISLPHTSSGIAVYYITATAEASSNLERFDGVKYGYRTEKYDNLLDMYMKTRGEGFGQEVKRRVILGTYVLSAGYYEAYYLKAQKVRTLIKKDFLDAFGDVDVILTPTTPELPFKIGEKKDDPLKMYLSDIFTVNVNLAGLPSVSLPCGFSSSGLPMGIQVISSGFKEGKIIETVSCIENLLKG